MPMEAGKKIERRLEDRRYGHDLLLASNKKGKKETAYKRPGSRKK